MTEQISLYYRSGSSDKVYQVYIEEKSNEGYVVNYAFGRRGTALASGTKTSSPVNLEQAQKIFNRLVAEKSAKGYKVDQDASQSTFAVAEKAETGIHCQLLNPIEDVEAMLINEHYLAQPKYDGIRFLLNKSDNVLTAINKKGLSVNYSEVFNTLINFKDDFLIDGELIGEVFHAFDILKLNGIEMNTFRYAERLASLQILVNELMHSNIKITETAFSTDEKVGLYDRLFKTHQEGIVFKEVNAPYIPGRPASNGPQLKHKFYNTASFIVTKINTTKRSIAVSLLNADRNEISAGNVTIPPNAEIPVTGSIVEVRYLYAYPESGSIYQPIYIGERTDTDKEECLTSQLKYKPVTLV